MNDVFNVFELVTNRNSDDEEAFYVADNEATENLFKGLRADLLYELTADDGETIQAVSLDILETLSNCFEIYIVD